MDGTAAEDPQLRKTHALNNVEMDTLPSMNSAKMETPTTTMVVVLPVNSKWDGHAPTMQP